MKMNSLQEVISKEVFSSRLTEWRYEYFLIIVTKYLFILLMIFYTWECFSGLRFRHKPYKASGVFQRQNGIIFVTYLLGIATIYLNQKDVDPVGRTMFTVL